MSGIRIGIIGLGLLGGSVCKAVKFYTHNSYIIAYGRNSDILKSAKNDGVIDAFSGLEGLERFDFRDLDIIIVATPVRISIDIIMKVLDSELLGDTLVLDVGSVKEVIVESLANHPKVGQFVACHPMAGAETAGYNFSAHDLFDDASVIITPQKKNRDHDIQQVVDFWSVIKARPVLTEPGLHDLIVASTSHLPHIAACLLVEQVSELCEPDNSVNVLSFLGGGFRDTTRIASGSPDVWSDILLLNQGNIIGVIDSFIRHLESIRGILLIQDQEEKKKLLYDFFNKIRLFKEHVSRGSND